jgi:signal transduction histidine kinase
VSVALDIRVDGRLPEPMELAALYVAAEALTNAAKHARATRVEVGVAVDPGVLRMYLRDGGYGGVDITRGSGLIGLRDRVEALGDRICLRSPIGLGTTMEIVLPLG